MSKSFKHFTDWRRVAHIPVLVTLQVIFIILFSQFVIYDPETAEHTKKSKEKATEEMVLYPSKLTAIAKRRPTY